jgi:predicted DNA binding protein
LSLDGDIVPGDLPPLPGFKIVEILSKRIDGDESYTTIVEIGHPLFKFVESPGRICITPGSNLSKDGLSLHIRGKPNAIRRFVEKTREVLKPDRVWAEIIADFPKTSSADISLGQLSARLDILREGRDLVRPRWYDILCEAWESGWYEIPRRITLVELAERISPGVRLSEELVRAESSVVQDFVEQLKTDCELTRTISERQKMVVSKAVEMGWYNIPRQCTLLCLAEELGLGRSTVSEHLVRAEATIIGIYLGEDPEFGASPFLLNDSGNGRPPPSGVSQAIRKPKDSEPEDAL